MRLLFLFCCLILLCCLTAVPGAVSARSYSASSQTCPVPADAPAYISATDVAALDLNPARAEPGEALVILDLRLKDGWARRRLFARYLVASGAPTGSAGDLCGAE